jgi:hypothetical protein
VVAPLAVMVALLPTQIIEDDEAVVTVGFGFTVKLIVDVVKQPNELLPVTE